MENVQHTQTGADGGPDGALPDHILAPYPDRRRLEYREFFLRHLVRDLVARLPRVPGTAPLSAVDVGCSNGRHTAMLAQQGLRARGLDLSPERVREARARHPACTFDVGDAQHLPLPDASVDCLTSFGLLQCLPDWRQALSEFVRVLRPGGVALVETNRAFPLWEVALKSALHLARRTLTPAATRAFLSAHTRAGGRPLARGLRTFSWRDLRTGLAPLQVSHLVVHDPRKHRVFHDFIWAITVTRDLLPTPSGPPLITGCAHCRRRGVMRVRETRG